MSNKSTLRNYFSSFGTNGDYQAYYADDIVWRLPQSHPYGAEHRGLASVRHMLARANNELLSLQSMTCDIQDMIEEGERIAVRMTQSYSTANGEQKYTNEHIDIFEFRDGKIVAVTAALDTHHMYQLGLYNAASTAAV
jgi:ketosteroid isomerase-like protein